MEIQEKIDILTAKRDGKTIQARPKGRTDFEFGGNVEDFNFAYYEYRVKPEPRELFVNEYPNGSRIYAHFSLERANDHASCRRTRVVKFREVLD